MFEDSTFESTGRLHTRSRGWMLAAFALNATIVLALVLIPLVYPSALPRMALSILMTAPATPVEEPKPPQRPEHAAVVEAQIPNGAVEAPSVIPTGWKTSTRPEVMEGPSWIALGPDGNGAGNPDSIFRGQSYHPSIVEAPRAPARISSGVMKGMLIGNVMPKYPPVAVAIHLGGTVVLQATISKSGTIENLRVISGPVLLQQAAVDAVKQWHYRPYLLNGEPVEVETTVNVEFAMQ